MTTEVQVRSRFERWLGLLSRLRPGEGRAVLLFMSYGFLVMFSYYMLKTLREPLLLTKATAETKSYAYAVIALVLLLVVPAYGAVFRRVSKRQLSLWTNTALLLVQLVFYALSLAGTDIGFAYYVWVGMFGVLITAQFWAFAADTFNVKTGQRVFPLIMIGASLGGLVGPALAGSLFQTLGAQQLMLITVVVLTAILPLAGRCGDAVPQASRSLHSAPDPVGNHMFGGFAMVLRNRYLLLIACLIVLLNWVNSTGEFILADVVVRHADAMLAADPGLDKGDIIAGFYGGFFATVNALSFLMQMFIVARVFRWIGVHGAILVLPVIALIGYGLMAFVPIFSMIRIVKIMENSTDYSMMNTARHALFLPLSAAEKYQSKIAIDAFFWRFGDLIQAAAVFIGLNLLDFEIKQFAIMNMALALVWLALAMQVGKHYKRQKKAVVAEAPPILLQALHNQPSPPDKPLAYQLPARLFQCDSGDVLRISVRPVDGVAMPAWLTFDAETLRFHGKPPADIDSNTWLTVRATNIEGQWAETRLGFIHR